MLKNIKRWLRYAFVSTVFCGLVYISVQQAIRQSANDPQIQMAEDGVLALKNGQTPQALISSYKQVNMEESLSPFIIFFDESYKPIESSSSLNGRIPSPPSGVFDFVRTHGKEWFTWEPKLGVREAAVLMKSNQGFILSGRSLREVEKRETQLLIEVGISWVVLLISTLILTIFILS